MSVFRCSPWLCLFSKSCCDTLQYVVACPLMQVDASLLPVPLPITMEGLGLGWPEMHVWRLGLGGNVRVRALRLARYLSCSWILHRQFISRVPRRICSIHLGRGDLFSRGLETCPHCFADHLVSSRDFSRHQRNASLVCLDAKRRILLSGRSSDRSPTTASCQQRGILSCCLSDRSRVLSVAV